MMEEIHHSWHVQWMRYRDMERREFTLHLPCQALGQEYPIGSSCPISAVGIWNLTWQMKKMGFIKARPHR